MLRATADLDMTHHAIHNASAISAANVRAPHVEAAERVTVGDGLAITPTGVATAVDGGSFVDLSDVAATVDAGGSVGAVASLVAGLRTTRELMCVCREPQRNQSILQSWRAVCEGMRCACKRWICLLFTWMGAQCVRVWPRALA